jgi:hypothetical protein
MERGVQGHQLISPILPADHVDAAVGLVYPFGEGEIKAEQGRHAGAIHDVVGHGDNRFPRMPFEQFLERRQGARGNVVIRFAPQVRAAIGITLEGVVLLGVSASDRLPIEPLPLADVALGNRLQRGDLQPMRPGDGLGRLLGASHGAGINGGDRNVRQEFTDAFSLATSDLVERQIHFSPLQHIGLPQVRVRGPVPDEIEHRGRCV